MFIATLLILLSEVNIVHSFYSAPSPLNKWTTGSCNPTNSCRRLDHPFLSPLSPLAPLRNSESDFTVTGSTSKWYPQEDDSRIPPPLTSLVDVNIDRRAVVYEVTLGRELGIEIVQGSNGVVVGAVTPGSKAAQVQGGIWMFDVYVGSKTRGMWCHCTVDVTLWLWHCY
jgi:hypothetical protein